MVTFKTALRAFRAASTSVSLRAVAAAFSAKDDAYNAARSAALGLDYAEKCRSVKDDKRALRAKLLYRRGVARSRNAGRPNAGPNDTVEDGLADVKEACRLDESRDRGMREAYRKLKRRADAEPMILEPTDVSPGHNVLIGAGYDHSERWHTL